MKFYSRNLSSMLGLYSVWWIPVDGARQEDLQGDGPGPAGGGPGHRSQRFGRRSHPGNATYLIAH